MAAGIYLTIERMSQVTKLSKNVIRRRLAEGEIPGALKLNHPEGFALWLIPEEAKFLLKRKLSGRKPPQPRKLTSMPLFDRRRK